MQFIYLHGFNSSPNAQKAQRLKEILRLDLLIDLHIPHLNLDSDKRINLKQTMDELTDMIKAKKQTILFASSFACFLAVNLENVLPYNIVRSYLISPFLYPHFLFNNSQSLPNYFQEVRSLLYQSNPDFELQLNAFQKFRFTNKQRFYIGKYDTQIFLDTLCKDLKLNQINYVLFDDTHEMIASFDYYWPLIKDDLIKIIEQSQS